MIVVINNYLKLYHKKSPSSSTSGSIIPIGWETVFKLPLRSGVGGF